MAQTFLVVHNRHSPPPQYVRGAYNERIPDLVRNVQGLLCAIGDAIGRCGDVQLGQQSTEAVPVLRQFNGFRLGAEDRNARSLQAGRQIQGRLPTILDENTFHCRSLCYGIGHW